MTFISTDYDADYEVMTPSVIEDHSYIVGESAHELSFEPFAFNPSNYILRYFLAQ